MGRGEVEKIRRKHEIDGLVALEYGLTRTRVRHITSAFLAKVIEALSNFEEVHLDSFGVFRMVMEKPGSKPTVMRAPQGKLQKVRVQRKLRVHFRKSETFKRMLRDKYGPNGHSEGEP